MIVKFCVLGEPKAKSRPRASVINGHARMYTPKDTVNYENLVRYTYQSEVGEKLEGAISMDIKAYYPIPTSVSKKKREEMLTEKVAYLKKNDLDNTVKIIADSLNGIAYDDDKQIYRLSAEKYYSDKPRVEIELRSEE